MSSAISATRLSMDAVVPPTAAAPVDQGTPSDQPKADLLGVLRDMLPQDAETAEAAGHGADGVLPEGDRVTPESMLEKLVGAIDRHVLELKNFSPEEAEVVERMPRSAWHAMNRIAGEAGITDMRIGSGFNLSDHLVAGLGELKLQALQLKANTDESPEPTVVDLSGLASLGEVTVKGDSFTPLDITVRSGVSVHAINTTEPVPYKSMVNFVSHQGMVERRPLYGAIYQRTATEMPEEEGGPDRQQLAAQLNVNGMVDMNFVDADSGELTKGKAVCSQLSGLWCDRRLAYCLAHADGNDLSGVRPRFSFDDLYRMGTIQKNIEADIKRQVDRMFAIGPSDLVQVGWMHRFVTAKLEQLKPGEFAHFAIGTQSPLHLLGLELQVKQSRSGPEFVVLLYDPNQSHTHARLVTDSSSHLQDTGAIDEFLKTTWYPGITAVYPWPPSFDTLPEATGFYGTSETKSTSEFLHRAMREGRTALVLESVNRMLAIGQELGRAELLRRLGGELPGVGHTCPGLFEAIKSGELAEWPDAVGAYFKAILDAPPHILDAAAKRELLRADAGGYRSVSYAIRNGPAKAVETIIEATLAARLPELSPEERWAFQADMLLAPSLAGVPELSEYCKDTPEPPLTPLTLRQHANLRAYTRRVAESGLPEEHKTRVCAAASNGLPAAALAVREMNPEAAAAMVLGILDAHVPAELRQSLLQSQGLSKVALIDALRSNLAEPADRRRRLNIASEIDRLWADSPASAASAATSP